jgi:hypothetical protein
LSNTVAGIKVTLIGRGGSTPRPFTAPDLLAVIASGFAAERVHLGHRLVGLADRGDIVEA